MIQSSIYINGLASIGISAEAVTRNTPEGPLWLACADPDFHRFIAPMQLRRMSRIQRRAIYTACEALEMAQLERPEAIFVGTGQGSVSDTEHFLKAIFDNDEEFLPPTPFMQSTHNTVAAQLAIRFRCHGANLTFSHLDFSFEQALFDAVLHFEEGLQTALVGGYDEMSDDFAKIFSRHRGPTPYRVAEGATTFVLSAHRQQQSYAQLAFCDYGHRSRPENEARLLAQIPSNCILVEAATYLERTGDYYTASAEALAEVVRAVHKTHIPHLLRHGNAAGPYANILLMPC